MSSVIWKFPLELTDTQVIQLPDGATILSAENQRGQLCLWAQLNPQMTPISKRIAIIGTGHPMPSGLQRFIGTVLMTPYVWHVFECEL